MFGDYYVVTDPTGLDVDGSFTVEDIDSVGLSPLSTVRVYDKKTGRRALYGVHVWDAGSKDEPITKAILYYDDASVKVYAADATDLATVIALANDIKAKLKASGWYS